MKKLNNMTDEVIISARKKNIFRLSKKGLLSEIVSAYLVTIR